jgi:hypothetical protein
MLIAGLKDGARSLTVGGCSGIECVLHGAEAPFIYAGKAIGLVLATWR